jgi:hypothetical protein
LSTIPSSYEQLTDGNQVRGRLLSLARTQAIETTDGIAVPHIGLRLLCQEGDNRLAEIGGPIPWAADMAAREFTDLLKEAYESNCGDGCGRCAKIMEA